MTYKKNLLLILISALFFSFSFPPFPFGFLVYFCLVFLFFALNGKGGKESFRLGYIWGLITNSLLLYWITWATLPGILGAILALSFYTAFLFLFYSWVQKSLKGKAIFVMPFLWIMMEYGRSLLDIGFPWLNLAYTQTHYLSLIQYASYTGNYGISFWIVWVNVLIYLGIKAFGYPKKILAYLVIIILIFSIPYLYGKRILNQVIGDEMISIAMIQGNIPQDVKWDYERLDYNFEVFSNMTREVTEKVDLILWPETAAPCYLRSEPKYFLMIKSLSESLQTPIILGSNDYLLTDKSKYLYFNSAFYFKPLDQLDKNQINPVIYNKIHLVPFSEWVPYSRFLGWLYKIKFGLSDYTPGKDYIIFENPKGSFATLICFEAVFPDLVRQFVLRGATFLVNITNDGWFGKTSGPFQHAQINIFRAIENRRSIARCANTGVSMFVDPYGRIENKTRIYVQYILSGKVSKKKEFTFYTRYGDYFAKGVSLVSFLFIAYSIFRKVVVKRL